MNFYIFTDIISPLNNSRLISILITQCVFAFNFEESKFIIQSIIDFDIVRCFGIELIRLLTYILKLLSLELIYNLKTFSTYFYANVSKCKYFFLFNSLKEQ